MCALVLLWPSVCTCMCAPACVCTPTIRAASHTGREPSFANACAHPHLRNQPHLPSIANVCARPHQRNQPHTPSLANACSCRSAELDVCRWEQNFARLPKHHQQLLANQPPKYARALQCIFSNHFFIQSMVSLQGIWEEALYAAHKCIRHVSQSISFLTGMSHVVSRFSPPACLT